MKSRHCEECSEWWPSFNIRCPLCDAQLKESSKAPMTEEEYKWLLATKKGRFSPLTKQEAERAEAEWQALEAEATRRGPRWSVVDLIADGFSVRAA